MATPIRDRLRRAALTGASLGACAAALLTACAKSPEIRPLPPPRQTALSQPFATETPPDSDPSTAPAPVAPPEPTLALADDFARASAALFSPDGALLAVEDAQPHATGCFGYTESIVHVYDTITWRERLIVTPGGELERWAFSPGGEALIVATRDNSWGVGRTESQITVIDMRSGERGAVAAGFDVSALAEKQPTARDTSRRIEATADSDETRITAVATGVLVKALRQPKVRAEARAVDDGRAVLFAALWPTGELATWNAVTGDELALSPPPEQPVAAFSTSEAGSLALVEQDGALWLYVPGASGLTGKRIAKVKGAVAAALDGGATRLFVSTAKRQILGLDARSGRRLFSVASPADAPETLAFTGDRLWVESRDGRAWEIDSTSGRILAQDSGTIGLISGGDPNAPTEPVGDAPLRFAAACAVQCYVRVGDSTVRLVPGEAPRTAIATDEARFEALGRKAESSLLCVRGSLVVPFGECKRGATVKGLVGATRDREQAIMEARRLLDAQSAARARSGPE